MKTCGTIYESGISEVAGRVLALEEYCKSRPMGPESSMELLVSSEKYKVAINGPWDEAWLTPKYDRS